MSDLKMIIPTFETSTEKVELTEEELAHRREILEKILEETLREIDERNIAI
jgi:hypothetical protein